MALKVNGQEASPAANIAREEVRNYFDTSKKSVEEMATDLVLEALGRDSVKEDVKALVLSSLPLEDQSLKLFFDKDSNSILTYIDGKAVKVKSLAKPNWWKRLLGHE